MISLLPTVSEILIAPKIPQCLLSWLLQRSIEKISFKNDGNKDKKSFDKGDFNLQEYTNKSFGVYHGEILDVKLSFAKELVQEASKYNFHPTQKVKEEKDGTLTVSFKASGSKEIMWHVFKWGANCRILAPKALEEEYEAYLEDCLNNN